METSWIVRETEGELTRHSTLGSMLRGKSVLYSGGLKFFSPIFISVYELYKKNGFSCGIF